MRSVSMSFVLITSGCFTITMSFVLITSGCFRITMSFVLITSGCFRISLFITSIIIIQNNWLLQNNKILYLSKKMFSPHLRKRKVDRSEKDAYFPRSAAAFVEVGVISHCWKTGKINFKNFKVYIKCMDPLSHLENCKHIFKWLCCIKCQIVVVICQYEFLP